MRQCQSAKTKYITSAVSSSPALSEFAVQKPSRPKTARPAMGWAWFNLGLSRARMATPESTINTKENISAGLAARDGKVRNQAENQRRRRQSQGAPGEPVVDPVTAPGPAIGGEIENLKGQENA